MSQSVVEYSSQGSGLLRPPLVVTDGRCYRMIDVSFGRTETNQPRPRLTSPPIAEACPDEADLGPVDSLPGGGYSIQLDISSQLYKYIIGTRGNTKATIEKDTKTKIKVPQLGSKGPITIEGASKRNLGVAKGRVELVAWANRLKEPVTHFICIPLNEQSVMERVELFKQETLKTCSKDRGLDSEVFQLPARMHLTIAPLRAFTAQELAKAEAVFEESIRTARAELRKEVFSLRGVECMNDDPSAVDVLYAKVVTQSGSRLQRFVDGVVKCFSEKAPELMDNEAADRRVKLHATLMNSSFRRGEGSVRQHRRNHEATFDCSRIMREFADFEFGQIPLTSVQLSKRGEFDSNGFYRCIKHYPID